MSNTTNLQAKSRNAESGSIKGTLKGKKFEVSWNSHELKINGSVNPEDHPHEETAWTICQKIDEEIESNTTLEESQEASGIGRTATITLKSQPNGPDIFEIHDLCLTIEFETEDLKEIQNKTIREILSENGIIQTSLPVKISFV